MYLQAEELAHSVQHSHTELIEQQRLQEEETNTLKQLTAEADAMQANLVQSISRQFYISIHLYDTVFFCYAII